MQRIAEIVPGLVGGSADLEPSTKTWLKQSTPISFQSFDDDVYRRLSPHTFNLENEEELEKFVEGDSEKSTNPESTKKLKYYR